MKPSEALASHRVAIRHVVESHRARNPRVFGSVLRGEDTDSRSLGSQDIDMLSQLYSALETETSRHLTDISLDIDLDASQVIYVATANGLRTLDSALLSRFEVISIGVPSPEERRESAQRIVESALTKLGVRGLIRMSPGSTVLLAEFSPRIIRRAVEKVVGAAFAGGRDRVGVEDFEAALFLAPAPQGKPQPVRRLH